MINTITMVGMIALGIVAAIYVSILLGGLLAIAGLVLGGES